MVSSDPDIRNLIVLQGPQYGGIVTAGGGIAVDMIMPISRQSPDSAILRIAGQYQGSGPVTLLLTGLWGGLRFEEELRVDLPSTAGAGVAGAGIWAYQQGEAWARGLVKYDLEAVKQLGKDYHIVNRQMSLLALEPGMDLWEEMPGKVVSGNGTTAQDANSGAPASLLDSRGAFMGQNTAASLDKATLEDILNATVGTLPPGTAARAPGLEELRCAALPASPSWSGTLPEAGSAGAVFRILDLQGRVMAEIRADRTATGFVARWQNPGRKGAFVVMARSGGRDLDAEILPGLRGR